MGINLGGEDSAAVAEARRRAAARMEEKNATVRTSGAGSSNSYKWSADSDVISRRAAQSARRGTSNTSSVLSKPNVTYMDNPDFIYPSNTMRDNAGNLLQIHRGYIRRLHEFFERIEGGPTLFNRKVKFQFQPEQVVRSVAANMNTQFFFNQDPSQLTVPKYGESTYVLELLFNREAELRSGKYKIGNKVVRANLEFARNVLVNNPEYFINGDYDPSWVCGIGVLADLMVLDAVIGQGFNTEMANIVKNISNKMESTTTQDGTTDDTDTSTESQTPVAVFTDANINPNLGNTAFLTPVPVRVQLAPWMMIEGFVLNSEVNIHKFNSNYVPSQAKVFLNVQAIYMGFAKEKGTVFTIDTKIPTGTDATPDSTSGQQVDIATRNATLAGLESMFVNADDPGAAGKDLFDWVIQKEPKVKFNLVESNVAKQWRPSGNADRDISMRYEATVKIYWHSYVSGASNSRGITKTSASGGSHVKIDYTKQTSIDQIPVPEWGTKSAPFKMTSRGEVRFNQNSNPFNFDNWVIDDGSGGPIQWDYSYPQSALWPFEDDKFNVELEIKLYATRYGVDYDSPQRIQAIYNGMKAGDDNLWNDLSIKVIKANTAGAGSRSTGFKS